MSMRGKYLRKLRTRIWGEGRRIVHLRRQALTAERSSRLILHNRIDNLKLKRERDVARVEELCARGEGVVDELRTGVQSALDRIGERVGASRGE